MLLNFTDYSATQRYHVMTQTIIPRPIAWALTSSENNHETCLNLAPFSYFTAVCSEPPLLMLSVGNKPTGEAKDTLSNVLKNKQMVIHIASQPLAPLVTQSAATLAHGESEITQINQNNAKENTLAIVPFEGFSLPRLAQCDIAYGCELYEIKTLGETPQTLIFVEVKQVYLSDHVAQYDEQNRIKIFADKVNPLARLGANEYAGITETFKVDRPK